MAYPLDLPALELLSASWPRPVQGEAGRWTSMPDWDAQAMRRPPQWREETIGGEQYLVIDWRATFRGGLDLLGKPHAGEMKGFHVVFRLRVQRSGTLIIFDEAGSIIRLNGQIVHEDREAHSPRRHELLVRTGDHLDVAQWRDHGDWIWGARLVQTADTLEADCALLRPYLRWVNAALRDPNGPALKLYTSATQPLRCALCVYSMILNGYRPEAVHIFGDYQWNAHRHLAIAMLLPFADIVPIQRVEHSLNELNLKLIGTAPRIWGAMKICTGLFTPPYTYCFMDDDVLVLDRIDDALALHTHHDLVYAPDNDYDESYRAIWSPDRTEPFPASNINTGLYLVRSTGLRASQAERLLHPAPGLHSTWQWEQGFFACAFSQARCVALPSQRYFYPVFDGLPGGILGYDWATNPCDFATVHFGGLPRKPGDDVARALVHEVLGRLRAAAH